MPLCACFGARAQQKTSPPVHEVDDALAHPPPPTKTERKEMAQAQVPAHVITRETQHKPPRQAGNVGVAAIPPPRLDELIPNRQAHEALESNGMLWLGMPLLFFAHVGHVASTLTHKSCRG